MTLLPELQASVDNAVKGSHRGLHHAILGPSPSGKSTQARAYADALAAKGFDGKLHILEPAGLKFFGQSIGIFQQAKGGIIIIDELERLPDPFKKEVLQGAMHAIAHDKTVVIFTGAASLERDILDSDPGMTHRLNKPIILTQQFTQQEMDDYHAAEKLAEIERQKPAEQRQREAAEKRMAEVAAQRRAEWKAAKNEDLQPRKKMAAPKTARFSKPQVTT